MWLVSSLLSKLVRVVVPRARDESSRPRFDRLLEPGRKTLPDMPLIGARVIEVML
jgi:hypothetical protein|tara:strand:+ start:219 stop:383 length:165 start_codon:yes stop_codon:yes gene_type:complete